MKTLVRGLLIIGGICALLLFLSVTVAVVKAVWFEGGGISKGDQVAVLELSGVIYESTDFIKELKELTDDDSVKAIVVRINSPGGLVAPSQEIYRALLQADAQIPVVVSMGSVAASGGYYAALGGRKLFASPGTLTASIGVIMEFLNTSGLYQWAKIQRYTLTGGKFKDIGSTARSMRPDEKELLMGVIRDIHSQFKAAVQQRRKLTPAQMAEATDGRVLTGNQAKKIGLVDALGGMQVALKTAKAMAKLPEDAEVRYPRKKQGFMRELLFGETKVPFEQWTNRLGSALASPIHPGWYVLLLAPVN